MAMKAGNFDTAVADFTRAIDIDPRAATPYDARGFARLHSFDVDGAVADFTQAITLKSDYGNAYFGRAIAEQIRGGFDAALDDYLHLLKVNSTGSDNPHFFLWLTRTQLEQQDAADQELTAYLGLRGGPKDWHSEIGSFLLGKMSEAELLKAAAAVPSPDKPLCEAYYYAGMKRLIAGQKIEAADYFRRCLATRQTTTAVYPLAHAEAKKLGVLF